MFSQYFGQYLLKKGLIKPVQLADALEYQSSVHLKLGVVAVNAGLMSPSQVEQIHNMQKRVDKRFGELAIDAGFINEEQLNALLSSQEQGHLMLGQALIERNYFTLEQLHTALENYKRESGMPFRQFNVVRNDYEQEYEQIFQSFGEGELSKTYGDYITLLVKNIIRFIDDNPTVDIDQLDSDYKTEWYVYQEINGKIGMRTGIACETAVFVKLAGKFAQEELNEADELAQASVGEFLNMHNGIFLVNMSNNGVELEMGPQAVKQDNTINSSRKAYIITLHLTWGKFDLVISKI